MNGRSAEDQKLFSSCPYGLSENAELPIPMAILTFAILFDLRLVLDEEGHLGKNHRKLAIPAGYVEDSAKRRPAMTAGHFV
jgi:hypothetical protein